MGKAEPNSQRKPCAVAVAADAENAQALNELYDSINKLRLKNSELAHRVTALERNNESLLKLVIGMAIGGYRYDRNAARSTTTKEITDDLRRAGVPLDDATVLHHLRRASQLLPDED